ncbi:MAG: hypothetical protein LLG37_00880 [Spirochaetia bacterium]|nr:hypothetical protein [Spirochaetia bacterium]
MKSKGLLKVFPLIILCFLLVLAGCGSRKIDKKKLGMINSFEVIPSETAIGDFDLVTNGYVNLEQIKKFSSNGKFSAKATFSIPADFLTTTQAAKTQTWIAGVSMGINTLTPLKVTDWTIFKKFAVDVYNTEQTSPDMFIKIIDQHGKEFLAQFPVKQGRNKFEILLEDAKTARIDTSAVVSFTLYLDTKGQSKDVVLYLDNIRLVP